MVGDLGQADGALHFAEAPLLVMSCDGSGRVDGHKKRVHTINKALRHQEEYLGVEAGGALVVLVVARGGDRQDIVVERDAYVVLRGFNVHPFNSLTETNGGERFARRCINMHTKATPS